MWLSITKLGYLAVLFSFILPNGNEHFSFLFIETAKHKIGKKNELLNPIIDIQNPLRINRKLNGGIAKDISMKRVFSRGGSEMNTSINQKDKKIIHLFIHRKKLS